MNRILALARACWREAPRQTAAVLALLFLVSLSEGAGLLLLMPLLSLVGVAAMPGGAGVPDAIAADPGPVAEMSRFFDRFGLTPSLEGVLAAMVLLVVGRALLQRASIVAEAGLQARLVAARRARLHAAILRMAWPAFLRERAAALAFALNSRVEDLYSALVMLLRLVSSAAATVVVLAIVVKLSPPLAALVLAVAAIVTSVRLFGGRAARRAGEELVRASDALVAAVDDALATMRLVRGAGAESARAVHFHAVSERFGRALIAARRRDGDEHLLLAVASAVALALLLWVAIARLSLPAATILLLVAAYSRLVPRLVALRQDGNALLEVLPAWDAVESLIARTEAAAEPASPPRTPLAFTDAIVCDRVSFRWGAEDDAPALDDFSCRIPARGLTVVIGPTGSGKSTLGDLLLGLLAPAAGVIRVDGVALDGGARAAWRRQTGYVPQDPVLAHATLAENMRWLAPEASDAALTRALHEAAAEFVFEDSDGLAVLIGDRGATMSGGERQRLALARALVTRPQLLVLDEPTSALDAETEQRVLATIVRLARETAVVLITHREAPLAVADQVIRLGR